MTMLVATAGWPSGGRAGWAVVFACVIRSATDEPDATGQLFENVPVPVNVFRVPVRCSTLAPAPEPLVSVPLSVPLNSHSPVLSATSTSIPETLTGWTLPAGLPCGADRVH